MAKKRVVVPTSKTSTSGHKKRKGAPSDSQTRNKRPKAAPKPTQRAVRTSPRHKKEKDTEEDPISKGKEESEYVSDEGTPIYRSQSGADDEVNVTEGEMVTSGHNETPKKNIFPSIGDMTNRYAVHAVVASQLFPRVKFLDRKKDLDYSEQEGTICKFVMERCNISLNLDSKAFWDKAKKWVSASIARLRSDKSTSMRNAFHGKKWSLYSQYVFYLLH